MNLIIRKGTKKDFPALLSLIQEWAILDGYPNSVKNSIKLMEKEKSLFNFFIAKDKSRAIGYAVFYFVYSTWVGKSLFVEDLYVKSEYQGKKIGTQLLKKVFEVAKKEDCKRLRFEVEEWNKNAQKFYLKLGAKMGDKWFNCDFDKKSIEVFLKKNNEVI